MVAPITSRWSPTKIRRIARCHDTGSEVVELVTDAGPGFAKFIGNKEGPHVLACEFVGTHLAALLGLQTLEHNLLAYDGVPEISLHSGAKAEVGPAWITRKEEGFHWSGHAEDLAGLQNPEDIALMVLLDLWTLNCDRYRPMPAPPRVNYGNVFLSRENTVAGKLRLVAMDHTHILTCGRSLVPAIAQIERVQDEIHYGLFPGFTQQVTWPLARRAQQRLEAVPPAKIDQIVDAVPREWRVEEPVREAMKRFFRQRRDWLVAAFPSRFFDQPELFD